MSFETIRRAKFSSLFPDKVSPNKVPISRQVYVFDRGNCLCKRCIYYIKVLSRLWQWTIRRHLHPHNLVHALVYETTWSLTKIGCFVVHTTECGVIGLSTFYISLRPLLVFWQVYEFSHWKCINRFSSVLFMVKSQKFKALSDKGPGLTFTEFSWSVDM